MLNKMDTVIVFNMEGKEL